MSSFQRLIKYIAIGFAVLLTIGILSGLISSVAAIVTVISGNNTYDEDPNVKVDVDYNHRYRKTRKETMDFAETFTDVKSLDLSNATGSLIIKVGDAFRVEAENVTSGFEAEVSSNGKLVVKEDGEEDVHFLWFDFNGFTYPDSKITVYLPADFVAKEIKIDSGAGEVTVEQLNTRKLRISAGAGSIKGENMTASEVKIEAGVGNMEFGNVEFTNVDLDCGVGNLDLDGVLYGDNKIECGMGEVNLNINGNSDDYDLDIDSGVGVVRVNGVKISDQDIQNRSASHSIEIDGGVGNVTIDFGKQSF